MDTCVASSRPAGRLSAERWNRGYFCRHQSLVAGLSREAAREARKETPISLRTDMTQCRGLCSFSGIAVPRDPPPCHVVTIIGRECVHMGKRERPRERKCSRKPEGRAMRRTRSSPKRGKTIARNSLRIRGTGCFSGREIQVVD